MNQIYMFDEWLLDKCQTISDWITRNFGWERANVMLSRICLNIFVVLEIAIFVFYRSGPESSLLEVIVSATFIVNMFFWGFAALKYLERNENVNYGSARAPLELLRKLRMYSWANVVVLILTVSLITQLREIEISQILIEIFVTPFFVLVAYFASCTPLPPSATKKDVPVSTDLAVEGGTE